MLKKIKLLHCCERCQNYWSCEKKWYRGEHGEENICCPLCAFFSICWKDIPAAEIEKAAKKGSKKK